MSLASRARQDQRPGLSGWGRTYLPGVERRSEDLARDSVGKHLSRGLGRSYGDSSLLAKGDQVALGTTLADRILGFDEATGVLRVEAGLCLAELNRLFLPRLWFTPVTPGTKFVTIGGMVASDVHGKNHHVNGTFGRHVRSLLLRTGSGELVECSREHETELFLATLGGMGLTGHILEVSVQLEKIPSPWIYTESYRIDSLDEMLARLKSDGEKWPMTVAWCDTVAGGKKMGRGILYVGRWATADEAPRGLPKGRPTITMPFSLPSGLLNRFTIGIFNSLVYGSHFQKVKKGFVDPDKYFYPLDSIQHWNRGYGKRGVTQHQSIIPNESGATGLRAMIETLADAGTASFLSVVKDCGEEGDGLLSFPKPGMSLALDLPIRDDSQQVIDRLNATVIEHGGRVYLTKDGMTRPADYAAMDPRVPEFLRVRKKYDPEGQLRSAQSRRLFGE
ncbi:MAG TPA: FAD-binding oxidoreductase [Polyangiaceae bacterium]|nr:FAD-binding oxidoreductase [Polyangiaceae bacterium]